MNVEPTGTNPTVTGAIRQAARMTGADFKYLLATAQVESNLNPNAQAATSSARGLFQFTEQTWLTTLKEQGGPLGYGPYANAITRQPSGDYAVSDPSMTQAVMNLRSDPNANALMAGAYTKLNAGKLADRLGRVPTEGELYVAHFLGPTGASRLIALADGRPLTPAAAVFPSAARANPTIFYDGRGNARSAGDVYRNLIGRYGVARSGPANPPANPTGNGRRHRRAVRATHGIRAGHREPHRGLCGGGAPVADGPGCRNRAGVLRPVPQHRRPRAHCAAGEFAVDVADSFGRSDQACTG